jgi:hypothetical protein
MKTTCIILLSQCHNSFVQDEFDTYFYCIQLDNITCHLQCTIKHLYRLCKCMDAQIRNQSVPSIRTCSKLLGLYCVDPMEKQLLIEEYYIDPLAWIKGRCSRRHALPMYHLSTWRATYRSGSASSSSARELPPSAVEE